MVLFSRFASAVTASAIIGGVLAHPGEDHSHDKIKRELQIRDAIASKGARSLAKCANSARSLELRQRAIDRRLATAERLRKKRGLDGKASYLPRRDLASLQEFEAENHNYTGSINSDDPSVLFSGNTSCILTPESTVGPYWVLGELVRQNVTEDQAGVAMHLEMQFIDVNTCEPISDLLIDIWNCNATGVYSGIGDGQAGWNTTFLRGLQATDDEGVVEFDTIVPGHYEQRATHTHTLVHINSTLLANGSYTGGTVSHIGQIYYNEELRSAVESVYPYSANTVAITSNDEDGWAPGQADNDYDPLVDYVYLGDSISDGLLTWISIGIDSTANHTSDAAYAAYLAADGGHESSGTGLFGGEPPNGTNITTAPSF